MKISSLVLTAILATAALGASAQYQGPPPSPDQRYQQGPPGPPPNGDPWAYGNGQPGNYGPEWDRRPPPPRGACFFTDANFRGHRFCVRSGDRLPALPGGYGHSISSIQTFGGAQVFAYARRNFQGQRASFGNAPDLGYTSNGPYRGWNDRINSIMVR